MTEARPGGEPERSEGALERVLEAVENVSPSEALEAVASELKDALGAADVALLVADLSGRALVRMERVASSVDPGADSTGITAVRLPLDGGPRERALRSQELQVTNEDEGAWTVLAPVTERGEALGLLEMLLPYDPEDGVLGVIRRTAHLLAFVVIANRRHTDLYEEGRRNTPYTLPAEIQRRLLPEASTCEGGAFTLAGWLEPAANIGGDTFDYSVGAETLHLSITDAMGHGLESALIATLCVGSLRNSRRAGETLLEQVQETNTVLSTRFRGLSEEGFVTGLFGRLELATGVLSLVNAGHVAPYLVRDEKVSALETTFSLPLGIYEETVYAAREFDLEPGDRVVFVTDGMVERVVADLDLTASLLEVADLHPREAVRRLADKVLDLSGGELADDASLLMFDWYGAGRVRNSSAGSDTNGAEHPNPGRTTDDSAAGRQRKGAAKGFRGH